MFFSIFLGERIEETASGNTKRTGELILRTNYVCLCLLLVIILFGSVSSSVRSKVCFCVVFGLLFVLCFVKISKTSTQFSRLKKNWFSLILVYSCVLLCCVFKKTLICGFCKYCYAIFLRRCTYRRSVNSEKCSTLSNWYASCIYWVSCHYCLPFSAHSRFSLSVTFLFLAAL